MGALVVFRALSDLNILDDCGALHAAAAANQVEACRLLLALRMADITAVDDAGRTAIHADASPDLAALRRFLGERLARFEVARYIIRSSAALPRTPSGKILKRALRAQALARLADAAADGESSA